MTDTHMGPWADTPGAAIDAALGAVRLPVGEYLRLDYADGGCTLTPIDPTRPTEVHVVVTYNQTRDQYRAHLARRPNLHGEEA